MIDHPSAMAPPSPPLLVPYLINLVDSPGHVDFSMDVATAARLCDGALVLVDVLEGICIQTHAVLRTAWAEGVRPILVLNKLDRLIVEVRLSPLEAYNALCRILEQANAIMSELLTADLMAGLGSGAGNTNTATSAAASAASDDDSSTAAASSSFEALAIDVDARTEAAIFFDPVRGNVVFASAGDGWAFTVDDFAAFHAAKLGLPRNALRRGLWGDWYVKAVPPASSGSSSGSGGVPKTAAAVTTTAATATAAAAAAGTAEVSAPRAVLVTSRDKAAVVAAGGKPAAVALMLDRLWAVYGALQLSPDDSRAAKIIASLGLDIPKRELAGAREPRSKLQAVMRAWLPLHAATLGAVARSLPSPVEAQRLRLPKLWPAVVSALLGSVSHQPIVADSIASADSAGIAAMQGGGSVSPPSAVGDSFGSGAAAADTAAAPVPKSTPDSLSPRMSLDDRLARVRRGIELCDTSPSADVVVFVSKMFAVPKASLPLPLRPSSHTVESPVRTSSPAPPTIAAAAGSAAEEAGAAAAGAGHGEPLEAGSMLKLEEDRVWWGAPPSLRSSPSLDLRGINSAARLRHARTRKAAKRRSAAAADAAAADDAADEAMGVVRKPALLSATETAAEFTAVGTARRAGEAVHGGASGSTASGIAAPSPSPSDDVYYNSDGDDEEEDALASSSSSSSAVETFIAFARVFSGVLRPHSRVFVLGPKYDPRDPLAHDCAAISRVRARRRRRRRGGQQQLCADCVAHGGASAAPSESCTCPDVEVEESGGLDLYMMMGRDLSPLESAAAGSIVGIGE